PLLPPPSFTLEKQSLIKRANNKSITKTAVKAGGAALLARPVRAFLFFSFSPTRTRTYNNNIDKIKINKNQRSLSLDISSVLLFQVFVMRFFFFAQYHL